MDLKIKINHHSIAGLIILNSTLLTLTRFISFKELSAMILWVGLVGFLNLVILLVLGIIPMENK